MATQDQFREHGHFGLEDAVADGGQGGQEGQEQSCAMGSSHPPVE